MVLCRSLVAHSAIEVGVCNASVSPEQCVAVAHGHHQTHSIKEGWSKRWSRSHTLQQRRLQQTMKR
eukprot:scaffold68420_cov15-Tisochrysis_lutea.AAC.1